MQLNLMHAIAPNSSKLSSLFHSFQKHTYNQNWSKSTNIFMNKRFLTFKQFYLDDLWTLKM